MRELETERLLIRLWHESDFEQLATFFSEEENAKYVGGIKTREESWELMAAYIGHWQMKGYSYMAVVEKATRKIAGCIGLWNSDPWPEPELGYWFLKEMQGKGYAYEAGMRMKKFAFETKKFETLVSYIAAENIPSIKLAEKLGAVYEKDIQLLDFGKHSVYRYTKD